ncbi:hypothetical protein ACHAXT_005406 [Thalassiosira profunda]
MPKLSHALPRTPTADTTSRQRALRQKAEAQARDLQKKVEEQAREYVVEGQFSEECVELKVRSREEEILRELGIRHLEDKISRPRYTSDETDADILKQAGVRFLSARVEKTLNADPCLNERILRPLGRKEAKILQAAGVTGLAGAPTDEEALGCDTETTAPAGESHSTVNSAYAERELQRRWTHGWASTGEECGCGMPIIQKSKGDFAECVVCGVVGGDDDDENCNPNADIFNPELLDRLADLERGVIDVASGLSTITPSLAPHERLDMEETIYETAYCRECEAPIESGKEEETYCSACAAQKEEKQHEDEEAYKEELGQKLFEGWELTTHNCPSCNLPLICEGEGSPSVCLRCG